MALFIATLISKYSVEIAAFYTEDPLIIYDCEEALPMMAFFLFFYSISKTLEGVTRGLGKHYFANILRIFSFFAIVNPTLLKMIFGSDLSVSGAWLAPCIVSVGEVVFYLILFTNHLDYD